MPLYLEQLAGTSPTNPDTDGDGINDWIEWTQYGTDPTKADTDGDGVSDAIEIAQGSNPRDPLSFFGLCEDVNRDGSVNVVDSAMVRRKLASSTVPSSYTANRCNHLVAGACTAADVSELRAHFSNPANSAIGNTRSMTAGNQRNEPIPSHPAGPLPCPGLRGDARSQTSCARRLHGAHVGEQGLRCRSPTAPGPQALRRSPSWRQSGRCSAASRSSARDESPSCFGVNWTQRPELGSPSACRAGIARAGPRLSRPRRARAAGQCAGDPRFRTRAQHPAPPRSHGPIGSRVARRASPRAARAP